jgi:hypothetical protein
MIIISYFRIQARNLLKIIIGICIISSFGSLTAHAFNVSGALTLDAVDMTGENSYKTTFDGGQSLLKWPIDVKTVGVDLLLTKGDTAEVELGLFTKPWGMSEGVMQDSDFIDESHYSGRSSHDGVDIYSESKVNSRALVFNARSRIFPLHMKYLSAGFSAGYDYQEFDYRAYNTRQVGYGTWSDQTNSVSGIVSLYSEQYDIYSLGLALKSSIDDVIIITLDAAALPWVTVSDEDNHLRRSRISMSTCRGSGYKTDFTILFKAYKNFYISSHCALSRMRTDGHQTQFWYGDDPATPHFNDAGDTLSGIKIRIDQQTFQTGIGATYRF